MLFHFALGNRENSEYADFHALTRMRGGMDIATAERELVERVARFVKAELKRADLTYEQLADRLREMGHNETKISVANKINRGTFPATFFIAVMRAIGRERVDLSEV
jgi:ribosome-binding protein aMBF1 (putative translation factor)